MLYFIIIIFIFVRTGKMLVFDSQKVTTNQFFRTLYCRFFAYYLRQFMKPFEVHSIEFSYSN